MDPHNNMIVRVLVMKTDDKGKQQMLKASGRNKEILGDQVLVPKIGHYGLSSHAPVGSHAIALMINGNPDQTMIISAEHPDKRPANLAEGETQVYGPAGNYILMKANGDVVIHGAKIILDGNVYLGGADASKPAAMKGTIDTGGFADVSNLATKVLVK